ncbi:MAG: imidazole glycerol phosphate synthase subunit HisH [Actinomycetales bacterium]
MKQRRVVVLDYGSGNIRSVQRALERAGAVVQVTSDAQSAMACDGLVVPGVGAFAACMQGLRSMGGDVIIDRRLAGGRPVLGICVGMQILFDEGVEHGDRCAGLGQWPGIVQRLPAPVLPHMGWNTVRVPAGSTLFEGIADQHFTFVHSFAAQEWVMPVDSRRRPAVVTWAHHGVDFVAGVENGPLVATQFHPEKSSDAGLALLRNWITSL